MVHSFMQNVLFSLLALSICFALAAPIAAADTDTAAATVTEDQLAQDPTSQMTRWLRASQPGAEHQRLDDLAGRYTVTIRAWLTHADQPPMQAEGEAEYRWVLGGRWLQQRLNSRLMGLPYEGLGMLGYDRTEEHYASYWQDSLSTATRSSFGEYDEQEMQLVMRGTAHDPATGAEDQPIRYEIRFNDDNSHRFRAFDLSRPDGQQLAMEILYEPVVEEEQSVRED